MDRLTLLNNRVLPAVGMWKLVPCVAGGDGVMHGQACLMWQITL
jgi:hypothetical protein